MTSSEQPAKPGDSLFPDDPYGGIKNEKGRVGPSPREIATLHARSDVDSSTTAQHHTLGIGHNQGAPGDHSHDGKSSRKVGTGLALSISGAKGSVASEDSIVAMLQQVIEFTDSRT